MIKYYKLLMATFMVLSQLTLSYSYAEDNEEHDNPNVAQPTIPSLAPILESAIPSIVNVAVQGMLSPSAQFFDDNNGDNDQLPFGIEPPRRFESLGSGVIIDPDKGYIITSSHVIQNADIITVTLHDGRRLNAEVIGADPETDIAILRIEAEHLESLPLGDSNQLQVGNFVVAIGNPFGLNITGTNQSATFGIISALGRSDLNIEGFEDFIQTDAAINPGNSGGALVNMSGQLIGINTAIVTPMLGNVGIGLAVPVNMARQVTDQLIEYGSIRRGLLGIFVQHLTPELADAFDISGTKGALITQINSGSPADEAGLKAGDVIISINDEPVQFASQVRNIIGLLRTGSRVQLEVLRQGKVIKTQAVITDVKQHEEELQFRNPFLFGLALQDFERQSPFHGHVQGVQIIGASENSDGWRSGLRPGDVIVEAGSGQQLEAVTTVAALQQVATRTKDTLVLHILRGSGSLYIIIQ